MYQVEKKIDDKYYGENHLTFEPHVQRYFSQYTDDYLKKYRNEEDREEFGIPTQFSSKLSPSNKTLKSVNWETNFSENPQLKTSKSHREGFKGLA